MRSSAARNSPMRRRLNMTVRRATSVGCAVKTGTMSTRLSQSRASSALMPTRRISHSVPASEPRWRPAPPLSRRAMRRRLRWLVSARLMSSK